MSRTGFTLTADISGAERLFAALADEADQAAQPAALAAADVLYDAVRANVQQLGSVTGNLLKSIYRAYSKDNSGPARAVYHISWRTKRGGLARAPHGHLVERGYVQRYVVVQDQRGHLTLAVRPEMQGKPRPRSSAPRAVKDAYYVTLPNGPRQVPGKFFVRRAEAKAAQALAAAEAVLLQRINARIKATR